MDRVSCKPVLALPLCLALLGALPSAGLTGDRNDREDSAFPATSASVSAVRAPPFVSALVPNRGEHIAWNLAFWALGLVALTAPAGYRALAPVPPRPLR
jgi:hypothetical protein